MLIYELWLLYYWQFESNAQIQNVPPSLGMNKGFYLCSCDHSAMVECSSTVREGVGAIPSRVIAKTFKK